MEKGAEAPQGVKGMCWWSERPAMVAGLPHASWRFSELSASECAELQAIGGEGGWVWTHFILSICPMTIAAVSKETDEGMVSEI